MDIYDIILRLLSENNEVVKRELNVQMVELRSNIEQRLTDMNKDKPKTVEENERVQMGRISVAPTSLTGQVGGDMTLGYLALLLEPIQIIMDSWVEGAEVPIYILLLLL
eukprot:GHVR01018903.1.p1 GENE.GHVR01018903.1~~GHVR01018903.1.p1  ORF type:complete len:109 (+),score=21.71 GHVR01018903.1:131-457(+)